MKEFKLSRSSENNLKGVRKEIPMLIERVLKLGVHDFGIPEFGGIRTPQEQNNLFHRRDSRGKRVTHLDGFNKLSYHQSGNAFDIYIYDEHGACWACHDKYQDIAMLMKHEFDSMKEECLFAENEELTWCGDWIRFRVRPHFEIRSK